MIDYKRILDECWYNGIKVVQKPTQKGFKKNGYPVKLNLEINKTIVKFGEKEFTQNSKELESKIEEIYRHYHSRIS
tara:strand:- start:3139 stop:3366 length:228 start_codon:yes stop_codon:yes gene_type:complete